MIVVSDTSVVTALIQTGRVNLLSEIPGSVFIPEAVARELAVCHVSLPAWIQTQRVRDQQSVERLCLELDIGGKRSHRTGDGTRSRLPLDG